MTRQWRLHPALKKLAEQVNAVWPKRSRVSDGTIGDVRHAASKSDHNPNSQGVVCALDITHDPANGCDAGELAEALRQSRDPRIKYVIWSRRIFSSLIKPWEWRPYNGSNPHTKHVHISVGGAELPWTIRVKE